jgi:hypothetical protein
MVHVILLLRVQVKELFRAAAAACARGLAEERDWRDGTAGLLNAGSRREPGLHIVRGQRLVAS